MALVSDTFNRADSTSTLGSTNGATDELGSLAWSALSGTWGISSNQAYVPTPATHAVAVVDVSTADVVVEVTTVLRNFANGAGVAFRVQDANNFWYVRNSSGGNTQLFYVQAGVSTQVGTNQSGAGDGDALRVICRGPVIQVWRNDGAGFVQKITTSSSLFLTATKHGLKVDTDSTSGCRLDSFSISSSKVGFESVKVELAEDQPFSATTPSWTNVTSSVKSVSIDRGRNHFLDPSEPGTCTVTFDNTFGQIVPDYVGSGPPANTLLRVSALDSTWTRRYLFTGFVDPTPSVVNYQATTSTTSVTAHDLLTYWNGYDLPFVAPYQADPDETTSDGLPVETYSGVIGAALFFLFSAHPDIFPAWATISAGGQTIMQAIPGKTSFLSVLQNMVQVESGALIVAGNGDVYVYGRDEYFTDSRLSSPSVTFDDSGAGDCSFSANDFKAARTPMFTYASCQRANDTVTASYTATIADDQGLVRYPNFTGALCASGSEASDWCYRTVQSASAVVFAPTELTLYPRRDGQLDAAVQRELLDWVEVQASFMPNAFTPDPFDCRVERIRHQIDANGSWTCTLTLSSWYQQSQYIGGGTNLLVMNDATTGALDGTRRLL